GAGAVSAAVTALVADLTRDSQRTKAMAMIGASIGVSFGIALVGSPWLYGRIGMGGLFGLTALCALASMALARFAAPDPRAAPRAGRPRDAQRTRAVAMLGASIGVSFGMALAGPPWLYGRIGMGGPFGLTALCALASMALVRFAVPDPQAAPRGEAAPVGCAA